MPERHPLVNLGWVILAVACVFACRFFFCEPSVLVKEYGGERVLTPAGYIGWRLTKVGDLVIRHFDALIVVGGILFVVTLWVLFRSLDKERERQWERMSPEERQAWCSEVAATRVHDRALEEKKRRRKHVSGSTSRSALPGYPFDRQDD